MYIFFITLPIFCTVANNQLFSLNKKRNSELHILVLGVVVTSHTSDKKKTYSRTPLAFNIINIPLALQGHFWQFLILLLRDSVISFGISYEIKVLLYTTIMILTTTNSIFQPNSHTLPQLPSINTLPLYRR